MNKEIVKVKDLASKSKKRYVYKNINFEIKSGEVIGLLGHNGAGKSTMLRNLATLERPQSGEIYFAGKLVDINKLNTDVVLIPDEIKLTKSFKIKTQVKMMQTNYGYNKEFLDKYLKLLKLDYEDEIGSLSKGNQEILQIIIMLSLNTKLVIFDEPFSAIDIFRRELIIQMIIETSLKEERAIIITTHLVNEIEDVLTRILYLNDSEIIMDKQIEEIQEQGISLVEFLKDYFKSEVVQ